VTRDEATIYLDLCRAAGVNLFGSAVAQRLLETATRLHGLRQPNGHQRSVPQELLLSLLLRATRQGSFKRLPASRTARSVPSTAPTTSSPSAS
jgi:hypothetical protein